MIVSPRLTRAALAFLLFGSVAALLPAQDTTALADVKCTLSPQYLMRLTSTANDTQIPNTTTSLTITPSSSIPFTLGSFVSSDGGATFQKATDANYKTRSLIYTLSNTGASGTFSMGADSSKNLTKTGQTSSYALDTSLYRTGLYATQTGMTGSITVKFSYNQITLIDSRALTSK